MNKEKILLAVGHRQLEEYLENELKDMFDFVGPTVHREGILKLTAQMGADIVVIRETLEGSENILSIVYQLRTRHPDVRIVFLAGNRKPGDDLMATLVNYGVYDILYGTNIPASSIINIMKSPNSYSDVKHLQPAPKLDEKSGKVLFEEIGEDNDIIDNVDSDEGDTEGAESEEVGIDNVKKKEKKASKESALLKFAQNIKIPQIPVIPNMRNKDAFEKNREVQKNKIVTFIGGKNGVGTTSIGVNTAYELANMGKKVIYLEVNEHYPALSYWYELGYTSLGIDTSIDAIVKEKYNEVDFSIVRSKDLKKSDSALKSAYKKFPDTLDFMFFSREYITGIKGKMELKLSKELYLHLLYQGGYDYVFIDVQPDISNPATINGLLFSNVVVSVVTQDVSTVGYHLFHLNELEKKGLIVNNKNIYLVNRYEESDLSIKEMKDWLQAKDIITFPQENKEFINANLNAFPALAGNVSNEVKSSILNIINKITR